MYRLICHIHSLLFISTALCIGYANAEVLAMPSQRYYEQYAMFDNSEIKPALGNLANLIGSDFNIIAKECGVINAYYSPSEKAIILCYEYLADGDNYIKKAYKRENIATQAYLDTGIFFYVLLHELGHAVIDVKQIPVIGGEEDAADRIAAIIMLKFTESNPVLAKAMFIGFLSYNWNKRFGFLTKLMNSNNLYADEHPFNEQRVFNMVCLAYGKDPSLFVDVARAFKLSPERARRCADEYQDANTAVRTLLK